MALIKCPECGKEISNQAVACPHCGFGMKATTVSNKRINSNAIPLFILIVCFVCGCICFAKFVKYNGQVKDQQVWTDLAEGMVSMTDPKWSAVVDTSRHSEHVADYEKKSAKLKELKNNRLIFGLISGACAFGAVICIIIIGNNNKQMSKKD